MNEKGQALLPIGVVATVLLLLIAILTAGVGVIWQFGFYTIIGGVLGLVGVNLPTFLGGGKKKTKPFAIKR